MILTELKDEEKKRGFDFAKIMSMQKMSDKVT
jgi:hypothetical protein